MGLQPKTSRLHSDIDIQKAIFPEAAVSLGVNDQVVRASTTGTAFTITLPNVVEAKGRIYTIYMVARSATDDITIQDLGADTGLSDITLNAADERVALYSDGYHWYTLASENV